ncbi:MAG: hypothetical protein AAFQ94_28645 [Bacteroidota bacterium]
MINYFKSSSLVRYQFIALFISFLFLSCQEDETFVNEIEQPNEEFTFVYQPGSKLTVDKIPQHLFPVIKETLIKEGREDEIKTFLNTYDEQTGKIKEAALPRAIENNIAEYEKMGVSGRTEAGVVFQDSFYQYRAHVKNNGWLNWRLSGTAGTTGQSRQMEAMQFRLTGNVGTLPWEIDETVIKTNAHVKYLGWLGYKNSSVTGWSISDTVAGTTGQARQMEAVKIKVKSSFANVVRYRAHVAFLGWLPWVGNDKVAGTTGQVRQMEAVEVILLKI